MQIRTITAALVVAAPILALGSPQAAACWDTGRGYGATTAAAPVAPRRYGYMSYGYSSPAYYDGYYGGIGVRRPVAAAAVVRRNYGYGGRAVVPRVGSGARIGRTGPGNRGLGR
jgi:hypothetical protein